MTFSTSVRDMADAAGGIRVQAPPLLVAIALVPSSRVPNSSTAAPDAAISVQPAPPTTGSATFRPSQPAVTQRPPLHRATMPACRRSDGCGSKYT